jgi:hypothetical protein
MLAKRFGGLENGAVATDGTRDELGGGLIVVAPLVLGPSIGDIGGLLRLLHGGDVRPVERRERSSVEVGGGHDGGFRGAGR